MDTWTPPVIVDLTQSETGNDCNTGENWQLTRNTTSGNLSLVRPDGVSLTIDFATGKTRHRTTESGMGAQALSKALGVRQFFRQSGDYPVIVDATGGLGQDAWALASLGCTITLIERHPVVYALLADGLARARDISATAATSSRISLIQGDATRNVELSLLREAHAVYLDPMYPSMRKKANSKKGMQFLHALLGPPPDDDPALLLWAVSSGVSRVAVKRPKGAPLLAGTNQFTGQRTTIDSPNTRYDVYHCLNN